MLVKYSSPRVREAFYSKNRTNGFRRWKKKRLCYHDQMRVTFDGRKFWSLIAVGAAGLGLLYALGYHWVAPPFRKADEVMTLKTTAYCPCGTCCGWECNWFGMPIYNYGTLNGTFKKIGQTASGRMARPGTVAVDPKVFPRGTRFYIPGYGWGIAQDIGGAIKEHHLDLFFWTHAQAGNWGVQELSVRVWYP
jgi:3D (Asp-Asp-Asp) domain-containing protein